LDPQTKTLKLVEHGFPELKANEVLVRVQSSPINPSDRLFCQGVYGVTSVDKVTPGFEGLGTVVQTGKNLLAKRLMRKRVAGAVQGRDGFWAEYVILPAEQCLVLGEKISDEAGSSAFVNPLSALALIEPITKKKYPSILQTAAASQLGRMIERWCRKHRIPIINVVHRPDLKLALLNEGFTHVLDSSHENFGQDLKRLCRELDIRYAIDAVGGKMTGLLSKNLPESSEVIVYGVLSGQACEIDPADLIFRNIKVKGFWLSHWLKSKNPLQLLKIFSDLKKSLESSSVSMVAKRIPLEAVPQEITNPSGSSSFGKILITP